MGLYFNLRFLILRIFCVDGQLGRVVLHIISQFYAMKKVSETFIGFLTKNYTAPWALVDTPFSIIRLNAQCV